MADELVGKQFGGYEILAEVGRGGMAVVYQARQVSMNRTVAVKILPRQFLHDQTFRARFDREVAVVSKLEHRAIVPVYDHGEHDEMPYIVMRFMDAGSVDDLLIKGPLPPEEVEKIVGQIAPGLDYAHTRDVLHRDIKPSNILLDSSGDAYLTDFGIARVMAGGATITTSGVVGTPSYMSPEQAQGLKLDGRSDVYGLAVVIFEMLTGHRPYVADTPYSVAVMHVTAPVPSSRDVYPAVPLAVDRVVQKGMAKNREVRYQSAVELAEALNEALHAPDAAPHKAATKPINVRELNEQRPDPDAGRVSAPIRPAQAAPQPVYQAQQPNQYAPPMAASPGGTSGAQPYVREPTPPSQSPVNAMSRVSQRVRAPSLVLRRRPSNWRYLLYGGLIGVVFFGLAAVVLLLLLGNQPASSLLDAPTATPSDTHQPLTPSAEGSEEAVAVTLTVIPALDPLHSVSLAQTATARARQDDEEDSPTITPTPEEDEASAGTSVAMADGGFDLDGGQIIFFADRDGDDDLYLLDLATGLETQITDNSTDDAYPAVSPDGRFITFVSDRDGDPEIMVMDIDGQNLRQVTRNNVEDRTPIWSPDGEHIYFASDINFNGEHIIYEVAPDGTGLRALTSGGNRDGHPSPSPDGRYLVYNSGSTTSNDDWEIYRLDLNSGDVEAFTGNDYIDWSPAYSPDGRYLAFHRRGEGFAALWVMSGEGLGERLVYDGRGYEWGSSFSPDGQYIAFTSNESGQDEVYVTTLDGGDVHRLTTGGGAYPAWVP